MILQRTGRALGLLALAPAPAPIDQVVVPARQRREAERIRV